MKKPGRPKEEDRIRNFLLIRKHLNLASISRDLGINRSNLTKFRNGYQKLTQEKRDKLEQILKTYGYKIKK